MKQDLMTIKELIAYLVEKPSINTVYKWTTTGKIPFRKIGRKLFFSKKQIDKWNNDNRPSQVI